MTEPLPDPQVSRSDRMLGAAMMTIGGLLVVLCGGCTLLSANMLMAISAEGTGASSPNAVIIPLITGGPPTVAGALLFLAGWRRYRKAISKRSVAKTFE